MGPQPETWPADSQHSEAALLCCRDSLRCGTVFRVQGSGWKRACLAAESSQVVPRKVRGVCTK